MHRCTELLAQNVEVKCAALVQPMVILLILQDGLVGWQASVTDQCLFHVCDRAYLAAAATAILGS